MRPDGCEGGKGSKDKSIGRMCEKRSDRNMRGCVDDICINPALYLLQYVVIIVLERQIIGIQFHEHHGNRDAEDDLSPAAGGDDGHNGSHQNPANGLNHL